ncbi:hypothetical protein [Lysobacter antibioticus]|uniref:hypothetical protein n=1 Tax=Lysobacter antibioticus TaxID=84531 RepID=UPI00034A556A|nr:hypothetical protein [Lysobacter antibioticus]
MHTKIATRVKQGLTALSLTAFAAAANAGAMSEAVSGGVDKAELLLIGVVVLTISGVVLMVRSGKRVAS